MVDRRLEAVLLLSGAVTGWVQEQMLGRCSYKEKHFLSLICINAIDTFGGSPLLHLRCFMRLDRFDLNLLIALEALLEERNVTRAAARMHVGQSAASAALGRLRDHFGDELLMPVGRRLVLSPLAQTLVQPVRDTLRQARETLAYRTGFDPAQAQCRFRVGASDYVTTVLLAGLMQTLAVEAPGVVLDIRNPPASLESAMEQAMVDLLVMPQQYARPLPFPQEALFEDEHACLLWSGHLLADQPMRFEDYVGLGHVAVRFGDARSMTFEDWFLPRYGQQRRIEATVDNFSTLGYLVVGTQRVATLHWRMAVHFAQHLPVVVRDVPVDMPRVVETMVWPHHLDQDPAHGWLRRRIAEFAATLPMPRGQSGV